MMQAKILTKSKGLVKEVATALKTVNIVLEKDGTKLGLCRMQYLIGGHTHRAAGMSGLQPKAKEMSYCRARAVMERIVGHGMPAELLFAKGFGGTVPIGARASRNRRVEVTVVDARVAKLLEKEAAVRAATDLQARFEIRAALIIYVIGVAAVVSV